MRGGKGKKERGWREGSEGKKERGFSHWSEGREGREGERVGREREVMLPS